MPRRVEARPFFRPDLEEQRYLPECPRVIGGSLLWISIQYAADRPRGGINVLDLASRENVHHALPGRPGFFVETGEPGELLVGLERRLVLYDLNRRAVTQTLAHIPEDPRVIINDGIAIPGGAIFGTKHLGFSEPVAALYTYTNALPQGAELPGGGPLAHLAPRVQRAGGRAVSLRPRLSPGARAARRADVLQRKIPARRPAGGHRQIGRASCRERV